MTGKKVEKFTNPIARRSLAILSKKKKDSFWKIHHLCEVQGLAMEYRGQTCRPYTRAGWSIGERREEYSIR